MPRHDCPTCTCKAPELTKICQHTERFPNDDGHGNSRYQRCGSMRGVMEGRCIDHRPPNHWIDCYCSR